MKKIFYVFICLMIFVAVNHASATTINQIYMDNMTPEQCASLNGYFMFPQKGTYNSGVILHSNCGIRIDDMDGKERCQCDSEIVSMSNVPSGAKINPAIGNNRIIQTPFNPNLGNGSTYPSTPSPSTGITSPLNNTAAKTLAATKPAIGYSPGYFAVAQGLTMELNTENRSYMVK